MKSSVVLLISILSFSLGFDFNAFQNMHQQQQQQQHMSYEDAVLNSNCQGYVCPSTKDCVDALVDCPCEFPKSQLKCILPDKKNYICISKPATRDSLLMSLYDDPFQGPNQKVKGMRDCGWVENAYKGLV